MWAAVFWAFRLIGAIGDFISRVLPLIRQFLEYRRMGRPFPL